MVIKRSSAAEGARLLETLFSGDGVAREAAAARLAILGARVVDRLTATLGGLPQPAHVVAVLDVLERIGDPRGAVAAEPLLDDPREVVAAAAVAVVRRALQAEGPETAARAMDALVRAASNPARPEPVRALARDALADLPVDVLASLRRRWPDLPEPRVEAESAAPPAQAVDAGALTTWADGSGRELSADEIRQVVARDGAGLPLPVLHRTIERLRALEAGAVPGAARDWLAVRGVVHQVLADRGSRVALYDLRESLERNAASLTVHMLAALGGLGDASCLEPVATAWAHTPDPWLKEQLRDVFATIAEREGITRRHAVLKRIGAHHSALVESLSTLSRTRPSRRPAPRT